MKGIKIITFFGLFLFITQVYADPLELLYRHYVLNEYSKTLKSSQSNRIQERYYTQAVDHDNIKMGTFPQRYFIDESYSQGNDAPVFLYLCGEGACAKAYLSGAMQQLAMKFKAKLIALEHRYYGKSLPRNSFSRDDLKFLRIDAALKDTAAFQTYLTKTQNITGKWVVFGGSYAGSLAAYYRAKYPNLVVGALASSAPVMALEDFQAFDGHITKVVGHECAENMRIAIKEVESSLGNPQRLSELKKMFQATAINNPLDFLSLVTEVGTFAVQYGKKNRFCDILKSKKTPLEGFAYIANMIFSTTGIRPLMLVPEGSISERPEDYNAIVGMRQWYYQSCNEYGYWQTAHADATQSTRSQLLNLSYYQAICQRLFGVSMQPKVEEVNRLLYQPILDESTRHIFFTNGSDDPWSRLSVIPENANTSNKNLAYHIIDNAAHCADLLPPKESESSGIKTARLKLEALLREWLGAS